MSSVAILVGNSEYKLLNPLPSCNADVDAIGELIVATGRYSKVHRLKDVNSTDLKMTLRNLLSNQSEINEVLFYFSGHGFSNGQEFYFCCYDFNEIHPNETGLSHSELTTVIRDISPTTTVMIIDACNSGTPFIKGYREFINNNKGTIKNIIQIASCQESETSLMGEPLREFTERFCIAATRSTSGPIYYLDIISALKDQYLSNDERAPHFVLQASARETFVEEASCLIKFKDIFDSKWISKSITSDDLRNEAESELEGGQNTSSILAKYESRLANKERVENVISYIFDEIKDQLSSSNLEDYYDIEFVEHDDYLEDSAKTFVARVLRSEKRLDEFVTADISSTELALSFSEITRLAAGMAPHRDKEEKITLEINLPVGRVQQKIKFIPRYMSLQQIILAITCAPSLENCYLFELSTRHPRTRWDAFADAGAELTRRWYKFSWSADLAPKIANIANKIEEDVLAHIASIADRLSKEAE
ncbi:caspase family protein [Ancylobacter sp. FA202]|uniref:caspase family protein n=1 Tax=Ancylobacter sp. FA202 TaxID=1111106 RepID=UPI0003A89386|nr:caspase family protein [Ancylobacter sp. FA202]